MTEANYFNLNIFFKFSTIERKMSTSQCRYTYTYSSIIYSNENKGLLSGKLHMPDNETSLFEPIGAVRCKIIRNWLGKRNLIPYQ